MTMKKKFIVIACFLGALVSGAVVLNQMSDAVTEKADDTSNVRYLSYILADEFRQTSQDLTRNCRTYVATGGDQKYLDDYNDILDWRSGKVSRPDFVNAELFRGQAISQSDIMKKLNFSDGEFALLKEASSNSNALIATEVQAMNSIANKRIEAGPFQAKPGETPEEFALRITFDSNYHSEVKKIMAPVNSFFVALDKRTFGDVAALQKEANTLNIISLILQIIIVITVTSLVIYLIRTVFNPLGYGTQIVMRISGGDYSARWNRNGQDELGQLASAFDTMVESLEVNATVASEIADGNLNVKAKLASKDDQLGLAIQKMATNLNGIIGQIQVSGEQIASGSGQVADSSQTLSQGATEQASSLEEISASLNQLSSQTTTNAENSNQANLLASEAQSAAQKGSNQMQSMIGAMSEINEAGQNISKIIKTIDEIAFQTNLLALNAAVEAARAGQHGKGFAVVAEEVRNLAARSAQAAEETAELIEGSVKKTENGGAIANQTAEALKEIVGGIGKVTDLISEIAAASNEQAQGVVQISQGITQIDQVTQQNTASAEESAAAAEELSGQADQLQQMLRRFTLQQGHQVSPPLSQSSARVSANVGWSNMEEEPLKAMVSQPQIALNDSHFGRY